MLIRLHSSSNNKNGIITLVNNIVLESAVYSTRSKDWGYNLLDPSACTYFREGYQGKIWTPSKVSGIAESPNYIKRMIEVVKFNKKFKNMIEG